MKSIDIHIRAISQGMPQPSITNINLKITCLKFHSNVSGANKLTHCGLVTPYSNVDPGQHWLRWLLVAWWHQVIAWTNVYLSLRVFCGIHPSAISHRHAHELNTESETKWPPFSWHFQMHFLVWILIKISPKFIPNGPINNILALVQIMAWCWVGDKPLS